MAEALNIESGEHDILLNSKTEFGRNAISVMNTRFGDKVWGQGTGNTSLQVADNLGATPPDPDKSNKRLADRSASADSGMGDEFSSQYSQRRKRHRTDSELTPVPEATASNPRRLQRNTDVATETRPILDRSGEQHAGNTEKRI